MITIPLNTMPDGTCRTIKAQYYKTSAANFARSTAFGATGVIKIRQATKDGYIEMESGGVFDGSYPDSKTRRGRVQDRGNISPTLTAQNTEIYRIEEDDEMYKIRKLTPLECFRLMGVSDEDANKMLAVNSNSQCYKQAGNSIVVDVLVALFQKLNIKQESI